MRIELRDVIVLNFFLPFDQKSDRPKFISGLQVCVRVCVCVSFNIYNLLKLTFKYKNLGMV